MLIPLHVQLDMYESDRDDDSADLIQLFEMVLVIPKNDASVTKALISRVLDGTACVVKLREGGFGLAIEQRDLFLITLFNYLHRRMRRNNGTGYDWWTTAVAETIGRTLDADKVQAITSKLAMYVTPDSHLSERSVTRNSRW